MYRLLKPKGRIAISDILLKQELPNELRSDMALYVGCIAGASRVEEYEKYLKEAGFKGKIVECHLTIRNLPTDLYENCRHPNCT